MKSISVFRIPDNKPDRRYQHKKAAYAVFSESDNPYFDFSVRLTALQSFSITISAEGLVTISCAAGLRGSSSGISAPTSTPFMKIPPPNRAKMEISEVPKASPTSNLTRSCGKSLALEGK